MSSIQTGKRGELRSTRVIMCLSCLTWGESCDLDVLAPGATETHQEVLFHLEPDRSAKQFWTDVTKADGQNCELGRSQVCRRLPWTRSARFSCFREVSAGDRRPRQSACLPECTAFHERRKCVTHWPESAARLFSASLSGPKQSQVVQSCSHCFVLRPAGGHMIKTAPPPQPAACFLRLILVICIRTHSSEHFFTLHLSCTGSKACGHRFHT